jgi:hypothetical protein
MAAIMRDRWWLKGMALAILALAGWSYLACLHCDSGECCGDPLCDDEATCHCACSFCFVNQTVGGSDPGLGITGLAFFSDYGLMPPDVAQRHFRPPRMISI